MRPVTRPTPLTNTSSRPAQPSTRSHTVDAGDALSRLQRRRQLRATTRTHSLLQLRAADRDVRTSLMFRPRAGLRSAPLQQSARADTLEIGEITGSNHA